MIIRSTEVWIDTKGIAHSLAQDISFRNNYWGKYDSPMAEYLDRIGEGDEVTGSVDWAEYVQRFGKRLLFSDDRGFVTVEKYASVAEAKTRFDEIDEAYCAWCGNDNEDIY